MSLPPINQLHVLQQAIDLTQNQEATISQSNPQVRFSNPSISEGQGSEFDGGGLSDIFQSIKSEFPSLPNPSIQAHHPIPFCFSPNDLVPSVFQQNQPQILVNPSQISLEPYSITPTQNFQIENPKNKKRKNISRVQHLNGNLDNQDINSEETASQSVKKIKLLFDSNIQTLLNDLKSLLFKKKFPNNQEFKRLLAGIVKKQNVSSDADKKQYAECLNEIFNQLLSLQWKEKFIKAISLSYGDYKIAELKTKIIPLLNSETKKLLLEILNSIKPGRKQDVRSSLNKFEWEEEFNGNENPKLTSLFQVVIRYQKNIAGKKGKNCNKLLNEISDLFNNLSPNRQKVLYQSLAKLSIEELNHLLNDLPILKEYIEIEIKNRSFKNQMQQYDNQVQVDRLHDTHRFPIEQNKKENHEISIPFPMLTNTSTSNLSLISSPLFFTPIASVDTFNTPTLTTNDTINTGTSSQDNSVGTPFFQNTENILKNNFSNEELNIIASNIPKIKKFIKQLLMEQIVNQAKQQLNMENSEQQRQVMKTNNLRNKSYLASKGLQIPVNIDLSHISSPPNI